MTDDVMAGRSAATGNPGTGDPGAERSVPPDERGQRAAVPERRGRGAGGRGDRVFRGLAVSSGGLVVGLIGAIGIFLLVQAVPALRADRVSFLTSRVWDTDSLGNLRFGILDLLLVTVAVSLEALVIAMPVALGIALFLTQYAPRRLARPFGYLVDLLAAVPSIVFGLWGIFVLAPALAPLAQWLVSHLGIVPLLAPGNVGIELGGNVFTAGIVLAVMILPIITAVSREVFERTPREQIEGALALGATKWEVVRTTVLPFGRAGYVSASMLGLGRALGETIALYVILSGTARFFSGSLFDGGATFASKIALAAPEFNNPTQAGAYIAAGLVLFLLTFLVNAAARAVASGGRPAR